MESFAFNSNLYASVGITTANEGSIANWQQYKSAVDAGKMKIRAVLWFAPDVLLKDRPVSDTTMLTIDDVLSAYEKVRETHPGEDIRLAAIHAQTARQDQLEKRISKFCRLS